MAKTIRLGVAGCGYWGPNLIRNFRALPECQLMMMCDLDTSRLRHLQTIYPEVEGATDYTHMLNGINLDADLARARSENAEIEFHRAIVPHREGVLRLLAYSNQANMGIYKVAIANFLAGDTPCATGTVCRPEIMAHSLQNTTKYGFGVNIEQPLTDWLGLFARWGWNEGEHESYAYTEVDGTEQVGAGAKGARWRRKLDRAGFAFVSNGISRDHQQYLALGGVGFLLGDGNLNYGREGIVESYYTLHVWRGIFTSVDVQHINNPGYNRDRGPVLAGALRLHVEF